MSVVIPKFRKDTVKNILWELIYGPPKESTGAKGVFTHFTPEVIPSVFPKSVLTSLFSKKVIPSVFPKKEEENDCPCDNAK
jgi:hypothetical protein